jgi:hypothetical protein
MGVIRAVTTDMLGSSMTSITSRLLAKILKPLASVLAIWEGRSVLRDGGGDGGRGERSAFSAHFVHQHQQNGGIRIQKGLLHCRALLKT